MIVKIYTGLKLILELLKLFRKEKPKQVEKKPEDENTPTPGEGHKLI